MRASVLGVLCIIHGLEAAGSCPACADLCAKPYMDCAACEAAECASPPSCPARRCEVDDAARTAAAALLRSVVRPARLPSPPAWLLAPFPKAGTLPAAVLATATITRDARAYNYSAHGARWTTKIARRAGFDRVLNWDESALATFVSQWTAVAPHFGRISSMRARSTDPRRVAYCWLFKPLVLLAALVEADDGDYVGWFDASRHHGGYIGDLGENVKAAIARIEADTPAPAPERGATEAWRATAYGAVLGTGPRDPARTRVPKGLVPGLDHCDVDCDRSTFYAFPAASWRSVFAFPDFLPTFNTEVDLCRFLRLPIRLGTNQLYRNSPEARLFVWDWIAMSILEMDAFCGEPLGDQLTLTILAFNRSLPYIDTCVYVKDHDYAAFVNRPPERVRACANMEKNVSHFLGALAAGSYEVIPPGKFDDIVDATSDPMCHEAWLQWQRARG